MNNLFRFLMIPSAILLLGASSVYKHQDANGNITYSDKPPMEAVSSEKTSEIKTSPSADPQAADRLKQRQAEMQKQSAERAENEKKAEEEKKKEAARLAECRSLKMALNQRRSHQKLYDVGENNERIVMTPEKRESDIKTIEEELKKSKCE